MDDWFLTLRRACCCARSTADNRLIRIRQNRHVRDVLTRPAQPSCHLVAISAAAGAYSLLPGRLAAKGPQANLPACAGAEEIQKCLK
jgi:hypothetical protein